VTDNRRSYTNLMRKPAMGLYDDTGRLVATIRADTPHDARAIYDGACLLGTVMRDPKPSTAWRALPSDVPSFLPRTFTTRKAAGTALVR
jgi:hypothetical protein